MWILLGIGIHMVHTVHDPISPRNQKGRTLHQPSGHIKYLLPVFTGGIHFVRRKAMQEKTMEKQRQKPMRKKENQDGKHNRERFVKSLNQ
jgi:hypothetical protein